MLSLYAAAAPVAWWTRGAMGLLAAGIAAAVCLLGAVGALLLNARCRGPSRALHGVVCSMAVRTGLPLVLAIALRFQEGALFKAGGVYYLLVFYLAALAIETPLSLPAGTEVNPPRPKGQTLASAQATGGGRACPPDCNR